MQQRVRHHYFSVCHTISAVDHGTRPRSLAAGKGEMAITTSTISQRSPVEMSYACKSPPMQQKSKNLPPGALHGV
jgi:hypothetical protein